MKKLLSLIVVSLLLSGNAYAQDLNFICTSPDKASDKNWPKSNIWGKFKLSAVFNKDLFYSSWSKSENRYSNPLALVDKIESSNDLYEFLYYWAYFYPSLTYKKTGGKGPMINFYTLGKLKASQYPEYKGRYILSSEYIRITMDQYKKLVDFDNVAFQQKDVDSHVSRMKRNTDYILVLSSKLIDDGKLENEFSTVCKLKK